MNTTVYERLQGKPMNSLLFNLLAANTEPEPTALTDEEIEYNEVHRGYQYSESEIVGNLSD